MIFSGLETFIAQALSVIGTLNIKLYCELSVAAVATWRARLDKLASTLDFSVNVDVKHDIVFNSVEIDF